MNELNLEDEQSSLHESVQIKVSYKVSPTSQMFFASIP